MAVVSSYGALTAIGTPTPSAGLQVNTSGPFYDGYRRTYAAIYKQQPAVRTVIDFFARNIAQLGLHVFRRVSDTDRERLVAHDLAQTIKRPNPWTTRFKFIESTVQDLGVYSNAFWLKVRAGSRLGLVRLPAGQVTVEGGLVPVGFEWTPAGAVAAQPFAPTEIVHFHHYDPDNPLLGYPTLETLRRVLAEEFAAGEYRQHFWKNAARTESVIERPATAPTWSQLKRDEFRSQWQQFAGAKSGMTPVLEDGMTLKLIGFSAKDSEYISARKLSREEVAAAFHVPLPMVGILDHATFSNIREQHKQLYQDCLGPWLTMLQEEIELQLLPEYADAQDVYVEFNIAEKLKGSFEEQASSLQTLVGRPVMTVNEGRARLNMPRDPDPDSDRIVKNLNQSTEPTDRPEVGRGADAHSLEPVLTRHAARQTVRLAKVEPSERAAVFAAQHGRWAAELAADLESVLGNDASETAAAVTARTAALLTEGQAAWPAGRVTAEVRAIAAREYLHA
jgi:HK97 family phage portal protein